MACKPDSVSLRGLSDHLSRGPVTRSFVQSTRRLLPCRRECGPHSSHWLFLLLDFAPDGGCLAAPVTPRAGGLLHHLFTLATRALSLSGSRSVSVALSTGHPARALPGIAPYGVRTFLTPEMPCISRPRPPGQLRLKTKCLPISYRSPTSPSVDWKHPEDNFRRCQETCSWRPESFQTEAAAHVEGHTAFFVATLFISLTPA